MKLFLKLESGHLDWNKQKRKGGHPKWDERSILVYDSNSQIS